MRKLKLMMLSLLLFAVAGRVLPYKAKYNLVYCTASPHDGVCPASLACPNAAIAVKVDPLANVLFVGITTYNVNCTNNCTTEPSVKLTDNGGQ